jgi:hypothetical protein
VYGHAITRSLVAAKADRASTKTIGDIFVQMVLSILQPGEAADRLLNGPTNDVWIDPWVQHLQRQGARYHWAATSAPSTARAAAFAAPPSPRGAAASRSTHQCRRQLVVARAV